MSQPSTTAFVDTSAISAFVNHEDEEEVAAFTVLLGMAESGFLRLLASERVRIELDELPERHRVSHLSALDRLNVHPASTITWIEPTASLATDPLYTRLSQICSGATDPALIVDAHQLGANAFITVDKRTILSHRKQLQAATGMQFFSPTEAVEHLQST